MKEHWCGKVLCFFFFFFFFFCIGTVLGKLVVPVAVCFKGGGVETLYLLVHREEYFIPRII